MSDNPVDGRWGDYVLRSKDEVRQLWDDLSKEKNRDILFILGGGFDPRMTMSVEALLGIGADLLPENCTT